MKKKQWLEIFAAQHRAAEEYDKLMPKCDDLALIVLKGHLVVEELLFALVNHYCANPNALRKAKLSFSQLIHIAEGLHRVPVPPQCWEALSLLNSLRNSLVHHIRPKEINGKIEALDRACAFASESFPHDLSTTNEPARMLEWSIYSLIGILSTAATLAQIVEHELKSPR